MNMHNTIEEGLKSEVQSLLADYNMLFMNVFHFHTYLDTPEQPMVKFKMQELYEFLCHQHDRLFEITKEMGIQLNKEMNRFMSEAKLEWVGVKLNLNETISYIERGINHLNERKAELNSKALFQNHMALAMVLQDCQLPQRDWKH